MPYCCCLDSHWFYCLGFLSAHQSCLRIASAAQLPMLIHSYLELGPRYAMGIGFAEGMSHHQIFSTMNLMDQYQDLLVCVALGVDMVRVRRTFSRPPKANI